MINESTMQQYSVGRNTNPPTPKSTFIVSQIYFLSHLGETISSSREKLFMVRSWKFITNPQTSSMFVTIFQKEQEQDSAAAQLLLLLLLLLNRDFRPFQFKLIFCKNHHTSHVKTSNLILHRKSSGRHEFFLLVIILFAWSLSN